MQKIRIFIFILCALAACKTRQTGTVSKNIEANPILTASDSLDFKIGQMVMIGIGEHAVFNPGDSLPAEIRANKVGGIVLYEKNISKERSKETLKKMIGDLQLHAGFPLFISIDEEGGKVHRMKEKYGFVKMPSAAYLGKLDNVDSTYYYTSQLAAVMEEVGINLNYAPTVDLALNPDNPVIAKIERSYSDDPTKVTRHSLASIRAFHDHNIKTIIKHFPGHGSSTSDSHLGIADVTDTWKQSELIPYKDILQSGSCDAIMTAHIINCRLDTSCLPATLSKPIITNMLRGMMKYEGVVFSDDMQMYAISKNYGFETAIRLSILAGVDVLMFANNVNPKDRVSASEVHAIIKKLVTSGEISRERIDQSYVRIIRLKLKKTK